MSSFMNAWENWSQRQWDRWGSKLPKWQKKIQGLELPEEVNVFFEKICEAFPEISLQLMKIVVKKYKKFGPKSAEVYLKQLLEYMKKITF